MLSLTNFIVTTYFYYTRKYSYNFYEEPTYIIDDRKIFIKSSDYSYNY